MSKLKLSELLLEIVSDSNVWYHGSPEVQKLETQGGFTDNYIDGEYIKDLDGFNDFQEQLQKYRQEGNMDAYHKLLNQASSFKGRYKFKSPAFLTNDYRVAKTYANASRAYDYQNAVEGVLKVSVDAGKNVTISAHGDRFRFIDVNKVAEGFLRAGVSQDEFEDVVSRFNYTVSDKSKIKTDMIAAIGAWFKFDTIDVLGVLDSHDGGSIKSTVRMVLNPNSIKIIK